MTPASLRRPVSEDRMQWINLAAISDRNRLEALETWFWDHGAVSVTVEDGKDNPIYEPPPGEQPLWEQVLVTGLFEEDVSVKALESGLKGAGYRLSDISHLEDRPWEREWLSRFRPMQFGDRLWVCPSGFEVPEKAVKVVRLDPGLAFGTGTHETTRLCLEYLDGLDVSGWSVIDYGCGSGVLGIAAAVMGADQVIGIDNDPQALAATADNAGRNGVEITTGSPGVDLKAADLVFANILAQPLTELSETLSDLTSDKGLLVLSGIMSSQRDWVAGAYEGRMKLLDEAELGGWVRLVWAC